MNRSLRVLAPSIGGALIALAVWVSAAQACSCVRQHPASFLPFADAAIVGTVESRDKSPASSYSHVIRVERAVKGQFGEHVTVHSALTSCQVTLDVGARVGLFLTRGAAGEWTTTACSVTDPDQLLQAAELPAPSGASRLVAGVDAGSVGAIGLTAGGKIAGYGQTEGAPLALARCGNGVVQATRTADGRVRVFTRFAPQLSGSAPQALAGTSVTALGCTEGGRQMWVIAPSGDQLELLSIRGLAAPRVELRRAASAAAIVGSKAYFSEQGEFRVVPLTGNRPQRTTRHEGQFAQFSVIGNRVAGRLRDGRAAVLDLTSGRLRTGERTGDLVWLRRGELLDAANGTVLDTQFAVKRRLAGPVGRLVGVEDATAYFASGRTLRRLKPGARRAEAFAELPAEVVGLTSVTPRATAAWHSCEKSAKKPLTT